MKTFATILNNERGEGAFLDVVIIAVVVIVLGCMLLALMKQLYSSTVFPKLKEYIESLFTVGNGYVSNLPGASIG
ncbi:MAG: hypothetical protein J5938_01115 [Clostridia bacterium]|nr:hypothetical protein [Clostridia bacterium]MBQ4290039.1 hypothetical protein [Clostridia bacterium]